MQGMGLHRFTRPQRLQIVYVVQIALLVFTLFDVLQSQRSHVVASLNSRPALVDLGQKVYITSIHWNDEHMLRDYWMTSLVNVAEALGPKQVYISIQESGSYDNTKDALRLLETALQEAGIRHTINLDDTSHSDEIAKEPDQSGEWVRLANGTVELRRVPYLSRQRNLALRDLERLAAEGETFDRVLFLNDIVFTIDDFTDLLNTRDGNYAAACSLDFSKPPQVYDTFALRDDEGHEPLMLKWPYFRSRTSRHAMKANQPVPVTSCWNGMVVMDAAPFYASTQPLRFRGIPSGLAELHVEGSECCLIHTDNPLTASKGVWLNPAVRVGYSGAAYDSVHPYGAGAGSWTSATAMALGSWENRLRRWATTAWFKQITVRRRLASWESSSAENRESGLACLINEMQVLRWYGWAHI